MAKKLYLLITLFALSILIVIVLAWVGINKLHMLEIEGITLAENAVQATEAAGVGPVLYQIVADSIINGNLVESAKDWQEAKDQAVKYMEAMERIGVPRKIVAFVMPTGYSFNLDGSTLYLSLAAMFVAQAANKPLSISQQVIMLLTLMLSTKGIAAVPRASLVVLAGTLAQFDLPLEGIAVILGVDELMDMARTATNVIGNCFATVDGQFDHFDTASFGSPRCRCSR